MLLSHVNFIHLNLNLFDCISFINMYRLISSNSDIISDFTWRNRSKICLHVTFFIDIKLAEISIKPKNTICLFLKYKIINKIKIQSIENLLLFYFWHWWFIACLKKNLQKILILMQACLNFEKRNTHNYDTIF